MVWLAGSGCGWNPWVWLAGVFERKYIDFLLIPTPLVSALFSAVNLLFVHFFKCFSFSLNSKTTQWGSHVNNAVLYMYFWGNFIEEL